MIDITNLLEILQLYNPILVNSSERSQSFCQVKELRGITSLEDHTLYIATVTEAKECTISLNAVPLILIEDSPLQNEDSIGTNNSIILLRKESTVDNILSLCSKIIQQKSIYLNYVDKLMRTFLCGADLKEMTSVSSAILQNPLVILDINFRILAFSSNEMRHDRHWMTFIDKGYCSFEYITELKRIMETADTANPFIARHNTVYSPQECIYYLRIHNIHIGYLVLAETTSSFNKINFKLCRLIGDLIANIVYTENELKKTLTEFSKDHIMLECLTDAFPTRGAYIERIRNTEFQNRSSYQVIIIDTQKYRAFDPRGDVLRNNFAHIFHTAWMLWFQGNVVTIIKTDELHDSASNILRNNISLFADMSLRFGISDIFEDLYTLPLYHRQSIQALRLAEKLSPNDYLLEYNDYKHYDLLLSNIDKAPFDSFYSNAFTTLLSYDIQNNSSYIETLYQYYIHNKNLAKSAQSLFIHKNTVSYRINKVREIFSFNIENALFRYQFLTSYYVKELADAGLISTADSFNC